MGKQKLIGVSNGIVTVKNEIQTDIFNGGTSEFFINMRPKDIPPIGHEDRGAFISGEKAKCRKGIFINGVYITGRLYYHLNFHKIALDTIIDDVEQRIVANPLLRDNEWIVFNEYEKAINAKPREAFILSGARQILKTEFECSTSLYQLNLFKNSEAMLLFTNSPDKQTYAKKAQVALSAGEPFMMLPLIDNDWKKTEIRFGETYKDNTSNVLGRLFLYNTDGDNASEIGAGKSLNYFAYDEIAKKEFRKSYEAVLPALDSPYGLRCSPILAFTGGDVVKSKDADELFHAPKTGKARVYINEGKETGFFMGGWYRQPFKYKKNFREYLNENGYDLKKGSSLDTMDILVTDFDKANKMIDEERADAAKASDPSVLNKKIMYSPRNIKEMFMKDVTNRFKKEYIEQQREFVKAHVTYDTVDLARDIHTKEVKTKQVNRPIIHDWKNPSYALNAPVCIYDYPKYIGYGVHVIGYDPVRENEVGNSESLCYITVWRRMHSDLSDPFRGKQVASWLGRKPTVKENNQLLLDLAEFYGAQIMYEHSDRSVLDFFEPRHKAHLLIDTIPLQKEISVKAKTKNQKGLKPTVPNQTFLLESALGFVNNEIDDDVYGYTTINDDVLLQQLEIYDPTENLDCYIGFAHAVAAYNYFEKFGTPVVTLNNEIKEKKKEPAPIKNAFGIIFKRKPTNAFGL